MMLTTDEEWIGPCYICAARGWREINLGLQIGRLSSSENLMNLLDTEDVRF